MAIDRTLIASDLEDVTLELVLRGIERAMSYGNTSDNFLFPNGDDVYIYGTDVDAPKFCGKGTYETLWSSISFRNYVGSCELLVKDSAGAQLVYNKIKGLSKEALAEEYYREISVVRHLIDGVAENAFKDKWDEMLKESRRRMIGAV